MANVFLPDTAKTTIGSPIEGAWGLAMRLALEAAAPAGEVGMFVGDVAPDGWLLIQGQTVTGFQQLYPVAWNRVPSAWKTGSSVKFPDTRSRIAIGAAGYGEFVLGAVGGLNEASITQTQMPPHSHGGFTSGDTVNHQHGFTTNVDGAHGHSQTGFNYGANYGYLFRGSGGGGWETLNGSGSITWSYVTPDVAPAGSDHSHSGATGGVSVSHQHAISQEGGAAAVSRMQAHFVISFMIRVY